MIKKEVVIVGAGAAGLMCAATAGQRGQSVLVIDHANKAGKKILMSGGGRCNFTNLHTQPHHFISKNPHFCRSALSRYTPHHFIRLVEKHAIGYHEKKLGQLFCNEKSKAILNLLLKECEDAKVKIQLNTHIYSIKKNAAHEFVLETSSGKIQTQSLVIATGGLSIPTMGASPFGYQIAEQFDINIQPVSAALVPFTLSEADKARFSTLSGVAIDVTTTCNEKQFRENLLFTHRGVSGPAILQISSYWNPNDTVKIDLLPNINTEEQLIQLKREKSKISAKKWANNLLPKSVVNIFMHAPECQKSLQDISHKHIRQIAHNLHHFALIPNGTEGYRTAEVTRGGVDCDALSSKTMEAKHVPNLYFIGEVVDVTGWLGGYNFQWAWASAVAAGLAV